MRRLAATDGILGERHEPNAYELYRSHSATEKSALLGTLLSALEERLDQTCAHTDYHGVGGERRGGLTSARWWCRGWGARITCPCGCGGG